MVTSYKELIVYQLSFGLTIEIYKLSGKLPAFEKHELGSQLRRAAVSIPANIAEGWAKNHTPKEFLRYLDISLGSCNELEVHLAIAKELGYITPMEYDRIALLNTDIGAKIAMLKKRWVSYK
jgi:four helix bundle protein